jgi:hypothetical protein
MNENDPTDRAPLPWYQRAWPWLFLIGVPVLVVFAQVFLRS